MAADIDVHCRSQPSERLQQQKHESDFDDGFAASANSSSSSPAAAATSRRRAVDNEDDAAAVFAASTSSGGYSPRQSWEETFQSLSRDLQMICGSNGSVDEVTTPGGSGDCSGTGGQRLMHSPMAGSTPIGWNSSNQRIHRMHNNTVPSSSSASPVNGAGTVVSRPVIIRNRHQPSRVSGGSEGVPTSPGFRSSVAHQLFSGNSQSNFQYPSGAVVVAGRLPPMAGMSPIAATAVPMRPGWRPVRVHHEETTDRLRQSLTKICRQSNSNNSSGNPSPSSSTASGLHQETPSTSCNESDPTTGSRPHRRSGDSTSSAATTAAAAAASKSRQLQLKESLKSGVRFRLDLAEVGCDPDFVFVAIRRERRNSEANNDANVGDLPDDSKVDRVLTVWNAVAAAAAPTTAAEPVTPLATVRLPQQTRVTAIACYITDCRILCIRERTKDTMHTEVDPPDSDLYVPILREDESQLTVAVTLHIADYLRFEDLTVRTIDDRLVIKGRRGICVSGSPDSGGECSSPQDGTSPSGSFTVVLTLPEGTYSRTVRAAYAAKEGQLLVTAARAPASRRMTCAF